MVRLSALLFLLADTLSAANPGEHVLVGSHPVDTIFFSADSQNIVASYSDKHVRTWSLLSGKVTTDLSKGGNLLAPGMLAERSADRKLLHIWDLTADRQIFATDKPVSRAALSSNGKILAFSSGEERSVKLMDPLTGVVRRTLPDGLGGAASLVFSPDGSTVVSANYDNDVRIWRTQSGELIRKLEDFTGAMFAAAFTPDGQQLVMGGLDETLYIYDSKTYSLQRKLTGHGETIVALAISPDGRTAVTGGMDVLTTKNPVKIVFWDLTTGVITRTVNAQHAVSSLAFAPDGKWLAMTVRGGKEISLFSLAELVP